MLKHVFISYSSRDQKTADLVRAALDKRKVPHWLCSDKARPGDQWIQSIVENIHRSHAMVVLLSRSANESRYVTAEVTEAFHEGITLIPVRLEDPKDLEVNRQLAFLLRAFQWKDVFEPPLKARIAELADHVADLHGRQPRPEIRASTPRPVTEPRPTVASRTVAVANRLGVHARCAMTFVDLAQTFRSAVTIDCNSSQIDGKSIMQIMMLAATKGTPLVITARGPDAEQAVEALAGLVTSGFGEE